MAAASGGARDDAEAAAAEAVPAPQAEISAAQVADWLLERQHLLSAYELWFELEDAA